MDHLLTDVHAARWLDPATHTRRFDPTAERAILDDAVGAGLAPAGAPAEWSELQWARLFQEAPGPAVRPVFHWRAAIRLLLAESGPATATDVLLANVGRHGRRRLGHAQEAPAARDVRRALAGAPEEVYAAAIEVAEGHSGAPEARRLAAYLFPDQTWWLEVLDDTWLDLAPCPSDVGLLPEEGPPGHDRPYLSTLALAYGDAAVPRIARWTAADHGRARILLDMGSDTSVHAWVQLWAARATTDRGFREGLDAAWAHPRALLRAGLRLAIANPAHLPTARRWLDKAPEAAAALVDHLQGEEAELLGRLRSRDATALPSGWADRVLGSRRFVPPASDGTAEAAATHLAPEHLVAEGQMVEPPRTWSREQTREHLLQGKRFVADLVTWILDDAGPVEATAALLDTAGQLGRSWWHPAANRVRNALACAEEEVYAQAVAVAVAARGPEPESDVAALSAFLFPDETWWLEVVDGWRSLRPGLQGLAIDHLVPLPPDVSALPELQPNQLGHSPLVPSWLAAYGLALEPLLRTWLGQDPTSDGVLVDALLVLGTPTAVDAVVRFAYTPRERGNPALARQQLDAHADAHAAELMRALAEADLPEADRALERQAWRVPRVAASVDHPKVRALLEDVHPPRPPIPREELPICFQPPRPAPAQTARLPRPTIEPVVVLSSLEEARVTAMRQALETSRTGLDLAVSRTVADGPEALREVTGSLQRTDATAALLDDLALVALAAHGPAAERFVELTYEHLQAPPVALCTPRVAMWMVENFDRTLILVDRAECTEPLSEYQLDDAWRTRLHTRAWVRRHPEVAAAVVLWGTLSPTGEENPLEGLRVETRELTDVLAAVRPVQRAQGPDDDLRHGARQALLWMLGHLPEVLQRVAVELDVEGALALWRDHPGTATARPHADLEWLEAWRLPWLVLMDGQVLSRPAVDGLLELLAHTDPQEPHPQRDAAIAMLAPHSARRLSEALRDQWEQGFDPWGLWVVDVPHLLGDPEADGWLTRLRAVGLTHVRDAAMDALVGRGDEQALIEARLSVPAMKPRGASPPLAVGLQARLDDLRASRGDGPWMAPRAAPPVTPPEGDRDESRAGLQVPNERFEALAPTGWMREIEPERLQYPVRPGLAVVVRLLGREEGSRLLGGVALYDTIDPGRIHPLAMLSAADWGQVTADLDRLTDGLAHPDKAALRGMLGDALDRLGRHAKWVCKWAAQEGVPSIIWERALGDYDAALDTLGDLCAPLGGFVAVEPHPDGVLALTWADGEQVVVGEVPEATTGVAMAVTRARARLLANRG